MASRPILPELTDGGWSGGVAHHWEQGATPTQWADCTYPAPNRYYGHGQEARTAADDCLGSLQDRRKAVRLGTVEAPDAATAIEKGAAEFKVPANKLMAMP